MTDSHKPLFLYLWNGFQGAQYVITMDNLVQVSAMTGLFGVCLAFFVGVTTNGDGFGLQENAGMA
jgi:hypothetical protein